MTGERPPFRLLPVMTLWANLHGSFMVGLTLAIFAGAEAVLDRRGGRPARSEAGRWGGFVLLAALAALLTPNGVAGFLLPFRIIGMLALQDSFAEWMSPDFHHFQPLEAWLLALLLLGFSLGLKLPPLRLLLLLGLVHLALAQARQGELLGMIGPLAIAASLGPQIAARTGAAPARALVVGAPSMATIAVLLGIGLALGAATLRQPLQRADDRVTPASALAAARRMGLSGPVFNSEQFGGYLIFAASRPSSMAAWRCMAVASCAAISRPPAAMSPSLPRCCGNTPSTGPCSTPPAPRSRPWTI